MSNTFAIPTPSSGLTLLEAFQTAQAANMHLITDGFDVKVSPIIPAGWREVPLRVKVSAPDLARVMVCEEKAAA